MMRRILVLVLALSPCLVTFAQPAEKIAVSLSYDDALQSQLDNALPALDQHGFKASFYLIPAKEDFAAQLPQWRAAAANGHELGNHSVFHPCEGDKPERDWVVDYKDLDAYTLNRIREELVLANTLLQAIDGERLRTYTPTCLDTETGEGPYLASVQDLFLAIKGEEVQAGTAALIAPAGQSGAELIQMLEEAAKSKKLINILFHGIGGDHLTTDTEAHAELLAYLDKNRDRFWVDNYRNIMAHRKGVDLSKTKGSDLPSAKHETQAVKKYIDLSYEYSAETLYWVTAKEFRLDTVFQGQTEKGYYYSANNIETAEHGGTHLDAPIHFAEGRRSVEQVPISDLVGPGLKVDLRTQIKDVDHLISIEDLKQWEAQHFQIPEGRILLLFTGHSAFYPDAKKYLGTENKGPEAIRELHFPGLSEEAARWLVEKRKIKAVGIDTPSIDYGQSNFFKAHVVLLSENVPVFENVAHLDQLPTDNFQIFALPMKIKGGSGAPLRIIAVLP